MSGIVSMWAAPERRARHVMTISPDNAERLAEAMLATLDTWMEQAEEIAEAAHPATGNKRRALHLKHAMAQAKSSLEHILKR